MLTRRHILASLPLVLTAAPARAAEEIGVSVAARGGSLLEHGSQITPLRPGALLYERDVVRTADDGFAELLLNTATQINLGPQSHIEIDRFVADIGGLITLGGAMAFDRPDDLPQVELTIRTTFAQIGVRGTRFFAGPGKGVFAVFVDRGAVTVQAAGVSRRLGAGEGVDIALPGDPPGEVVRWGAARIAAAFASVGL
ncbi:MAG: FecR family protein [Pseudomonadota bacterium]